MTRLKKIYLDGNTSYLATSSTKLLKYRELEIEQ
jgi:hypothetical protein